MPNPFFDQPILNTPYAYPNQVRRLVDLWRQIPNPSQWNVTPETARLLQHWRSHEFSGVRPFFTTNFHASKGVTC